MPEQQPGIYGMIMRALEPKEVAPPKDTSGYAGAYANAVLQKLKGLGQASMEPMEGPPSIDLGGGYGRIGVSPAFGGMTKLKAGKRVFRGGARELENVVTPKLQQLLDEHLPKHLHSPGIAKRLKAVGKLKAYESLSSRGKLKVAIWEAMSDDTPAVRKIRDRFYDPQGNPDVTQRMISRDLEEAVKKIEPHFSEGMVGTAPISSYKHFDASKTGTGAGGDLMGAGWYGTSSKSLAGYYSKQAALGLESSRMPYVRSHNLPEGADLLDFTKNLDPKSWKRMTDAFREGLTDNLIQMDELGYPYYTAAIRQDMDKILTASSDDYMVAMGDVARKLRDYGMVHVHEPDLFNMLWPHGGIEGVKYNIATGGRSLAGKGKPQKSTGFNVVIYNPDIINKPSEWAMKKALGRRKK